MLADVGLGQSNRLVAGVLLLLLLLLHHSLVLQQTVDLEPVGAAPVPGAALRHAHREALLEPARLARGSVLLVDYALVAVLALAYRRAVIVRSSEKTLAAFAGEGPKVVAGGHFAANSAVLVHSNFSYTTNVSLSQSLSLPTRLLVFSPLLGLVLKQRAEKLNRKFSLWRRRLVALLSNLSQRDARFRAGRMRARSTWLPIVSGS